MNVFYLQRSYLIGRQEAEHSLGHGVADVEQQAAHLVLEGEGLCVLEGGQELLALWPRANGTNPHLECELDPQF